MYNINVEDHIEQKIFGHDWKQFNSLGKFEQLAAWKQLQDGLRDLLKAEAAAGRFDYETIRQQIDSYGERLCDIPAEAHFYVVIDPGSFCRELLKVLWDVYADHVSKYPRDDRGCFCAKRQELNMPPYDWELEQLRAGNDGYYDFIIYQCKKCGTQWQRTIDDGSSNGIDQWGKVTD